MHAIALEGKRVHVYDSIREASRYYKLLLWMCATIVR